MTDTKDEREKSDFGHPVALRGSLSDAASHGISERASDAVDAALYRWLRDNAKEQLLDPKGAASEFAPDLRTHWVIPTLICSGPVGGYVSFDEAVRIAREASGSGSAT